MELFFDETQEGAAPVKEGSGQTEFAVAMRGYDRVQVDDYLARQEKWVADAQSRMATGDAALAAATSEIKLLRDRLDVLEERELNSSPRSIAALGERVERILAESWQAAEDLRQQSEAQVSARTAELEQHVAEQERRVAEVLRKTERRSADAEEKAKGLLRDAREGAERHTAESERAAQSEAVQIVAEGRAEAERLVTEAMARCDELEVQLAELAERRTAAYQELSGVRSSLEQALVDAPPDLTAPGEDSPAEAPADPSPSGRPPRPRVV